MVVLGDEAEVEGSDDLALDFEAAEEVETKEVILIASPAGPGVGPVVEDDDDDDDDGGVEDDVLGLE